MATEKRFRIKAHALSERGFHRCGIRFAKEGTEADVSASELERIKAEPQLVVKGVVELDDEKAPKGAPRGKAEG